MQDYLGNLKLARSLASSNNLSIKYEDKEHAMPRTDGRTLYLPYPDPLMSEHDWHLWNDACWHEIGHNFPENRDIFKLIKDESIDCTSLFGSCLNLMDDYRVDKSRTNKYYGMKEANAIAIPHHIKNIANKPVDFDKQPHARNILTLMAFDATVRGMDNARIRGSEAYITGKFDAEMQGWYKQLIEEYTERYDNHSTAKQELATLRDIFEKVFKINPKEHGDGTAQQQAQQGDGEQGEEGDEEAKGTKPRGGIISYEEWLKHSHEKDEEQARKGYPVRIQYDENAGVRDYIPHTDETNRITDFSKSTPGNYTSPSISRSTIDRYVESLNIQAIVGQARRLLQVETRKRPSFNQKKGRLDTSKIHRVTMPESSISERIFKTKAESKALDTAVTVLVDYSGSMQTDNKTGTAIAAALALESLFKVLKVNCEILGFTETGRFNETFVFKPFGSTVRDGDMIESMRMATSNMCSNCDGDSILVAYHRLMQQRNPRKVLVVLSDGSPSGGCGDIDGFTKKVIRDIEQSRACDIVGIGIEDANVQRLYKTHRVVHNASDLPAKLIETLEDILLERKGN